MAPTAGDDAHWHVPLAYSLARRVLSELRLDESDVVADVGCGLGRVTALAGRRCVTKVIGIEVDPALAAGARRNMRSLRGRRSNIDIVTADAATVSLDGVSVLILFNPFGATTTRLLLHQLQSSLVDAPRAVRIAYVNPTAEAQFEQTPWLIKTGTFRSPRFRQTVSYWTTLPVNDDGEASTLG